MGDSGGGVGDRAGGDAGIAWGWVMPWGYASQEWTKAELEKLREWREAGLTNGEIGMRLKRTKKAVQTKARVLGIGSGYVPRAPRGSGERGPERAGKVTLPTLPSLQERHE